MLLMFTRLLNRGVSMTSGLRKYDHVSHTDLLLVGSLLALLFHITHLSLIYS